MTCRVSGALLCESKTLVILGYEEFENDQTREVNEIKAVMMKKSNIKDVCALLDMKSSKLTPKSPFTRLFHFLDIDDVNKAFAEMHEEVEQKVYKKEYEVAMTQ